MLCTNAGQNARQSGEKSWKLYIQTKLLHEIEGSFGQLKQLNWIA